ncbi:MAG: hypothetical protein Q9214_005857, partial [Letrouitia sp. 1 TL-2023]
MSTQADPPKANGIEMTSPHRGGLKGGPHRGGRGPAPAKHIPWPEIFHRHMINLEGHMRMIQMVRKHTVEGTAEHRTICDLIDRTKEVIHISQRVAFHFVPPQRDFESDSLGSSSESMYHGNSPGDVEYGKATNKYGEFAARARAEGREIKPEGVEYVVGQSRGQTRKRARRMSENEALGNPASSVNTTEPKTSIETDATNIRKGDVRATDRALKEERPFFVIDTKPTPVHVSNHLIAHAKQRNEEQEPVATSVSKMAKRKHEGPLPEAPKTNEQVLKNAVEFEDISAEVDARMKNKEEMRVQKEEKKAKEASEKTRSEAVLDSSEGKKRKDKKKHKRKRESEASNVITSGNALEDEKPQKKKTKKAKEADLINVGAGKKRGAVELGEAVE